MKPKITKKNENNKNSISNIIGFASYHPVTCLTYYVLFIILAMTCIHPLSLIILVSSGIIYSMMISTILKVGAKLKLFIGIGLMITIINPIFNHRGRTVIMMIFNKPITMEALMYGAMMALSLLAIMAVFISYQLVINNHKFIYVTGKVLPKTAFVITMTLRYMPLLAGRSQEISLIHRANDQKVSPINRLRNGLKVISILITWSLESAITTADSMKSRAYGLEKRTSYKFYRFKSRDFYLLVFEGVLFITIMVLRLNGYLYLNVYPQINFSVSQFELYVMLILFAFAYIPILVEFKERLQWYYTALKT